MFQVLLSRRNSWMARIPLVCVSALCMHRSISKRGKTLLLLCLTEKKASLFAD